MRSPDRRGARTSLADGDADRTRGIVRIPKRRPHALRGLLFAILRRGECQDRELVAIAGLERDRPVAPREGRGLWSEARVVPAVATVERDLDLIDRCRSAPGLPLDGHAPAPDARAVSRRGDDRARR